MTGVQTCALPILFSQRSLAHSPESATFNYGTNSHPRWFADAMSPRWFAYTPLIELQEAVTDSNTLTFKFCPNAIIGNKNNMVNSFLTD